MDVKGYEFDPIKFRQIREERGFTQETLAWELGVTRGAVAGWERSGYTPQGLYILRFIQLFDLSPMDIMSPVDY